MIITNHLSHDKKTSLLLGPMSENWMPFIFEVQKIVCVDGGYKHIPLGTEAYLNSVIQAKKIDLESIGDGDSLSADLTHFIKHRLEPMKDLSDLMAAYKTFFSKERFNQQVILFGFSGGRLDHQLALIGDTLKFLNDFHDSKFYAYSSLGELMIFNSPGLHHFDHQGTLSLFQSQPSPISTQGSLVYHLEQEELSSFGSHGLSNVAKGAFQITSETSTLLILQGDHTLS